MSQELLLTYYGQVKAKKNSKKIAYKADGTPFVRSSDAAKAQEALMMAAFTADYLNAEIRRDAFQAAPAYKVAVEIWNQNRRKHDLDNQLATIMDALVRSGVLRDDDQETVPQISIRYIGVDHLDPRAEITITTLSRRRH